MVKISRSLSNKISCLGKTSSEKMIIKATLKNDEPPKSKYIDSLSKYILSIDPDIDRIIMILNKKTKSKMWEVVLKAFITIHHLMLEDVDMFWISISNFKNLFKLCHEHSTSGSWIIDGITNIISYRNFLQIKNDSYILYNTDLSNSRFKIPLVVESKFIDYTINELDQLNKIKNSLEKNQIMLNCNYSIHQEINKLLYRDSIRIHNAQYIRIIYLLENSLILSSKQAISLLALLRIFLLNQKDVEYLMNLALRNDIRANETLLLKFIKQDQVYTNITNIIDIIGQKNFNLIFRRIKEY